YPLPHLFVSCSSPLPPLHSFPTRRSSDLTWGPLAYLRSAAGVLPNLTDYRTFIACDDGPEEKLHLYNIVVANARYDVIKMQLLRSEEHTSELQSRFDLVCRLLLEKKKTVN